MSRQTREQGYLGEQVAREILRRMPDVDNASLMQLDWVTRIGGRWTAVEVKHKDRFLAPPYDGAGLDLRQIRLRESLREDTGIRTLLIVIEPSTRWCWGQYLDILEAGQHYDTRNGVRIYPLTAYLEIPDIGGLYEKVAERIVNAG